jgi:hypothetical protein
MLRHDPAPVGEARQPARAKARRLHESRTLRLARHVAGALVEERARLLPLPGTRCLRPRARSVASGKTPCLRVSGNGSPMLSSDTTRPTTTYPKATRAA